LVGYSEDDLCDTLIFRGSSVELDDRSSDRAGFRGKRGISYQEVEFHIVSPFRIKAQLLRNAVELRNAVVGSQAALPQLVEDEATPFAGCLKKYLVTTTGSRLR
jgi:hypothetical protein